MTLRRPIAALLLAVLAASCDDGPSSPVARGDRFPPHPVSDLSLTYDPSSAAVELAWTSPRDDTAHDRADRYEIRYSYSAPFDWERSVQATPAPDPLAAGSRQTFTLADPTRGRDLFAEVRAYDAAGNSSPPGSVSHVRVPGVAFDATCLDAISRAPVSGLDALLTAASAYRMVSDAAGRLTMVDVTEGAAGIRIESDGVTTPYHRLKDAFVIDGDFSATYPMIEYTKPVSPAYESILAILLDALITPRATPRTVKTWASYPIPWYAPSFVNSKGIDYRAVAERAAARWNEATGLALFSPVGAVPASGINIQFLPRSVMGIQNGVTDYTNDSAAHPIAARIRLVDDFAEEQKLYPIMLHELGHTIPLTHLPAGFLMFGGQPLPSDITDDEIRLVRLLVSLPNDFDLSIFDPAPPRPAVPNP